MENSRLFVRGLPPRLGEHEFKKYFSKTSPVTDAKLISHRKIGYVGFMTPQAAAEALKYHNGTFIRASKIHVEFAKSVAELRPDAKQRATKNNVNALDDEDDVFSAETEVKGSAEENPKLKEFLETMQPSKARTWANEDSTLAAHGHDEARGEPRAAPETMSDEEYEPLPKRQKRDADPERRADLAPLGRTETNDNSEEDKVVSTDNQPVGQPSASDADWLRGRTSQMLGLEDDEDADSEFEDQEESLAKGKQTKPSRTEREGSTGKQASETSSKTDEDLHEAAPKPVVVDDEEPPSDDRRLFVRNISYQTTEDSIKDYFSQFGPLEEVHLPKNGRTSSNKGFAYVQFRDSESAFKAMSETNAKPYQGRLLHVMMAESKREHTLDEFAISKLPHKKQQLIRRKAEAASSTFRWNTLFMNSDAVMASTASRLGVNKSEILDPTSSSAAVKQAHAETNIIQETKDFFDSNGVDLSAFNTREYSETVILVKNFSYGTTTEELKKLFEGYGAVKRLLMPPAGTMAIVEFDHTEQAKKAFSALAYRKLGDSVIFLEKAPKNVFNGRKRIINGNKASDEDQMLTSADLMAADSQDAVATATLFIKNLNFDTTSGRLYDLFLPLQGFMSARVKTKPDPKRPGKTLSMGFGFVEFKSREDAQAALGAMNGYNLDGHRLQIKASHKGVDAAEERRKEDAARKVAGRHTKIIIKNLPFETTRRDVRELFSPYGKLRSIRVPKKFDSSTRGFAFADFVTVKEAQNAMEALSGTHLLGRRLNLEYAAEEAIDPEKEIEEMSKKVGRQLEKVNARQLTSTGRRKKFTVHQNEEDDGSYE